jgi:uncharacterized cupin superfamily protein
VHRTLEETFYVLEGEFELHVGDETLRGRRGSVMFVPPGTPHSFGNPTDAPARLLLVMSPSGHDRYFVELAEILAGGRPDPEAIGALRERYETEQLSPLVPGAEPQAAAR